MTSEQVAQVLRKAANPVRMVIARIIKCDTGHLPPRKPVVCCVSACFIKYEVTNKLQVKNGELKCVDFVSANRKC